jgi:hypothetical protein
MTSETFTPVNLREDAGWIPVDDAKVRRQLVPASADG